MYKLSMANFHINWKTKLWNMFFKNSWPDISKPFFKLTFKIKYVYTIKCSEVKNQKTSYLRIWVYPYPCLLRWVDTIKVPSKNLVQVFFVQVRPSFGNLLKIGWFPSKLEGNRMGFYSVQVLSKFSWTKFYDRWHCQSSIKKLGQRKLGHGKLG